MGIRFEYGARKATNGPMIFFSDPVSEINLKEEIRGAIESRLCFYAYHMPGDMMVTFGSSEGFIEGVGQPGFVISPFYPDGGIITIPYAPTPRNNAHEEYPFPEASTSEEQHRHEVEKIIGNLKELQAAGNAPATTGGKIVAARVRVGNDAISPAETFLTLVRQYPDAYTFCFSTPRTGCWIGATPELLLESRGEILSTMALAGTRPCGTPGEWDEKNREEQEMVADYILSTLRRNGCQATASQPVTKPAGGIEHICTSISANPSEKLRTASGLADLLTDLSPTPATAGLPKEVALELIKGTERFSRAYYGGFCGPYRSPGDFTLFVILRCARIEAERYALFAGGGITVRSNPEEEWDETNLKLRTLETMLSPDNRSFGPEITAGDNDWE